MANNIIRRVWNQNRMVNIEDLSGMAFQAENGGHTFEISGIDDTGAAVALSGTVLGVFRRPDNADVAFTGAASGGVASVTLTDDCYAVPGRFGLTIFVTSGGQKTAVYAAVGTVASTNGGAVAGDTPQDVVDLINAIEAAVATIPASYTDLMAAIAPTYSSSALYPVGSYVWNAGKLYRSVVPITTAEAWTAAHWTAAVLGEDVGDLKSAVNDVKNEVDSLAIDGNVTLLNPNNMLPDPTFGKGLWGATNGTLTVQNWGDNISKKCLLTRVNTGSSGYLAIVMPVSAFENGKTYRISANLLKDATTLRLAALQNTNGTVGSTMSWLLSDVLMTNDSHSQSISRFHYDWTVDTSAFGNYDYVQIQFKCTNDGNWFTEPFIGDVDGNTNYLAVYALPTYTEMLTPVNLFEGEYYTDHYYGGTAGQYTSGSAYNCAKPQLLKAGTYLCLINKQYFGTSAGNKVFAFASDDGTAGGTAVISATLLQEISFPSETGSTEQIVHGVYSFTISDDTYVGINIGHGLVDPSAFMIVKGSTMDDWPVSYLYNFEPYAVTSEPTKMNASMMKQTSKIYGKKVAVNGDSICEGAGELGGFIKQVAGKNAMQAYNIGVGGGTLATGTTWSTSGANRHWISATIKDMEAGCDYYIFEGGVNDFAQGVPVGELTDGYPVKGTSDDNLDTTTVIGAMEYACRDLVTLFPGKKCGFLFVHGIFALTGGWAAWHTQYKPGMIAALEKWGVPYLDLEEKAPPLNLITSLKSVYTFNGDGWHPNAAGYAAFYTDKIKAWMESL